MIQLKVHRGVNVFIELRLVVDFFSLAALPVGWYATREFSRGHCN